MCEILFSGGLSCSLCHDYFIIVFFFVVACSNRVDLLFVLDGGNLEVKKNFIKAVIDKFNIGPNDTRVGMVLSDADDFYLISFNDTQSADLVKLDIDSVSDVGSSSGITLGLQEALEAIKDRRVDVKQVRLFNYYFLVIVKHM